MSVLQPHQKSIGVTTASIFLPPLPTPLNSFRSSSDFFRSSLTPLFLMHPSSITKTTLNDHYLLSDQTILHFGTIESRGMSIVVGSSTNAHHRKWATVEVKLSNLEQKVEACEEDNSWHWDEQKNTPGWNQPEPEPVREPNLEENRSRTGLLVLPVLAVSSMLELVLEK
ncbi:unnamed protein product [Lactuca saligna]|uniref:Uncharacterized protein n=1 Tax=Lactuca saligna TaxID=75948 RepID=A0AA35Z9N3_LACSI|nr:unnamed protein product [Lactuca saligna]